MEETEEIEAQEQYGFHGEPVPWTTGDVIRGVGALVSVLMGAIVVLTVGTLLILKAGDFTASDGVSMAGFTSALDREGLLVQWLLLTAIVMLAAGGGMLPAAWLYSVRKYRLRWASLGFRPFAVVKGVALALGVALLGLFVGWMYETFVSSAGIETTSPWLSEFTGSGIILSIIIISAVVVAPVVEEAFFRGFMLSGVGRRFGYAWGGLISAALFAVAHLDLTTLAPIFVIGLMLAWLYLKTGSIWPCIIAHSVYNLAAILIAVFTS